MAHGLKIIKAGFQSLIQDTGRYGVGHHGLSQGGAADEHASRWANHLLQNPVNAPVLEIALGMAEFIAETQMTIAITGADMSAEINGTPIHNWSTHQLQPNDRLTFQAARSGNYAYLAVIAGFMAKAQLGSCSTVMRNNIGKKLEDGETLEVRAEHCYQSDIGLMTPFRFIPDYTRIQPLTAIECYQNSLFSHDLRAKFFNQTFTVSKQSNRMGCQLEGPRLNHSIPDQPSEGIACGAIQIPASGQPVILMRDRQTIGGYPKIGCLTRRSISLLAQCRAGTDLNFESVTREQATKEWIRFERYFAKKTEAPCRSSA
ncbi:biotin-dependent carboxyltransferase family protein [Parendozoicomonas sp. Alg238-R29]|uniref:5-oxoprolinase subunit C family protein n=1 Tax=Parendozoicomonas sp. Alg238-R29 TaxID=2993446 RepID=UPI00248DD3A1|nr:biotin-dependent carboxyltransferase family protein [Parendozoicomonas sp. Alg238-R29]